MFEITPSKYPRIRACPASAVLPAIDGGESAAALRGSEAHRFLQLCSEVGAEQALMTMREENAAFIDFIEVIELDALPLEHAAEVAFAINPETEQARELGRGIERRYADAGAQATEICGTADLVGLTEHAVIVHDYKTGWIYVTAANNDALRLLALMAARTYWRSLVVVSIIRIGEDGHPWKEHATLDALDLDDAADELRETIAAVQTTRERFATSGTVDVTEGAHCRYCPARKSCPAKTGLIRAAIGEHSLTPITADNAEVAYRAYRELVRLTGELGSELKAHAADHPIQLDDGKVYGAHKRRVNEKLDGNMVYEALVGIGPDLAEMAAPIKREATVKNIGDAARAIWKERKEDGDKVTLKSIRFDLLKRVRERGGSNVGPDGERAHYTAIGEYDPSKVKANDR